MARKDHAGLKLLIQWVAGALLTNDTLHEWYPQHFNELCPKWGERDSAKHRLLQCPAVADVRREYLSPARAERLWHRCETEPHIE